MICSDTDNYINFLSTIKKKKGKRGSKTQKNLCIAWFYGKIFIVYCFVNEWT